MAEAMSEERRTEIRVATDRERWNTYCGHVGPRTMVTELLDEVERLSTQAAYMREQIEQLAQVIEERKTQTVAYRALAEQHQKRGDKLSALLAEIRETKAEWAADGPAGWMQDPTGFDSERFARSIVEQAAEQGIAVKLMRRLAGEWCEVPDA